MKELSLIETAFLLKKTDLFQELDLDMLISIADKAHQDIYDPKEEVFITGQKAYRFYIIAKGSVEIFYPSQILITSLKEHDCFGEESLLNDDPRCYDAVCTTNTLFITLSKPLLLNVISEAPQIAITLLEKFSKNYPCRFIKD